MPTINHQTIEQILETASPTQKILWNDLFLRFGERLAITQYYYRGAFAGSPISVYVARQLFLAYKIEAYSTTTVGYAAINYHDENNAVSYIDANYAMIWNTTGATREWDNLNTKQSDIWFSRISALLYDTVYFVGYRIGI